MPVKGSIKRIAAVREALAPSTRVSQGSQPSTVVVRPDWVVSSAIAAWLCFAQSRFLHGEAPSLQTLIALSIALPTASYFLRRFLLRSHSPLLATATVEAGLATGLSLLSLSASRPLPEHLWFAAAFVSLTGLARLIIRSVAAIAPAPAEGLRWVAMAGTTFALSLPLYTHRPFGSGDAYWYRLMMGDYVAQLREGIFPVWLGQTHLAFSGSIYPLRVAPAFQHLGGALDLLTAHSLHPVALVNCLLALLMLGACAANYWVCRAIMPWRPNASAALAVLFVLAPGTSVALCLSDQFMTYTAVIFLTPAFWALHRSWVRNDRASALLAGAFVAALWHAHAPTALWFSLVAFCVLAAKAARHWSRGREPVRLLQTAGAFLLLGSYPIHSFLSLGNAHTFSVDSGAILDSIQSGFPASVLPFTTENLLHPYRLGYAHLALLAAGLVFSFWRRDPFVALLSVIGAILLTIVMPVPWFAQAFWSAQPEAILSITNIWPMQRIYPILTALATILAAIALSRLPAHNSRHFQNGLRVVLVLAVVWTVYQANFVFGALKTTIQQSNDWAAAFQPSNVVPTRYSYVSFDRSPATFSHGHMNAILENRLLDPVSGEVLVDNALAATGRGAGSNATLVAQADAKGTRLPGSVYYELDTRWQLQKGRHYALRFRSSEPTNTGVLQIIGKGVNREYLLPDSGIGGRAPGFKARSFGTTPTSSDVVSLESEADTEITITLIYPERPPTDQLNAGSLELWEYDPTRLPIRVNDLTPYRVSVDSSQPVLLESPRVWQTDYRAKVNGLRVPVVTSVNGLAAVALPTGHSEAEVKYAPKLRIEIHYWLTLILITFTALIFAGWLLRPSPGRPGVLRRI